MMEENRQLQGQGASLFQPLEEQGIREQIVPDEMEALEAVEAVGEIRMTIQMVAMEERMAVMAQAILQEMVKGRQLGRGGLHLEPFMPEAVEAEEVSLRDIMEILVKEEVAAEEKVEMDNTLLALSLTALLEVQIQEAEEVVEVVTTQEQRLREETEVLALY